MNIAFKPEFDLQKVVHGCMQGNSTSQKALYEHFYGFAFSICRRYSKEREDIVEIMNDGYVKVLKNVNSFIEPSNNLDFNRVFIAWFKKIMINTSINYQTSRRNLERNRQFVQSEVTLSITQKENDNLAWEDLRKMIQQLSPAYRNTFTLYAIDGYKHEEIAEILGISIGTSKSNLLKARTNLRKMLSTIDKQKV